jgi:hypothetical protein
MSDAVDEPPSPTFLPYTATRSDKHVAGVGKAPYQRTDALAVLLARAVTTRQS